MLSIARIITAAVAFLALPGLMNAAHAQDLRLVMIERPGCVYCIVFKRDVAPIYVLSEEGQRAPLVHKDIRALPPEMEFVSRPFVTPTFILINAEGKELDRLTGYPGDEFFWPYISAMIARHAPDAVATH
jgi:hypothetical protein